MSYTHLAIFQGWIEDERRKELINESRGVTFTHRPTPHEVIGFASQCGKTNSYLTHLVKDIERLRLFRTKKQRMANGANWIVKQLKKLSPRKP